MKLTKFNSLHKKFNGKLVEFAGFEMPVYYTSITDEHLAVRNSVGVFDVSHMGEIFVSGNDALGFVQKITTNDASKLTPGKIQYSAMCYLDGGIVDDLLVYRLEDGFMLVVNASNKDKDFDWMKQFCFGDVDLRDKSDDYSLLAVQGPHSKDVLKKIASVDLDKMEYYNFSMGKIFGYDVLISRTGYTGELGYEIYFQGPESTAKEIWEGLFEAGAEFNIKPIGLGARDSLRLEMAMCLYGNDIDQTTNPLEAGLGWITKLNKPDFNAKDVLVKVKEAGIKRKLMGFELIEKGIPRHGYEIYFQNDRIGYVTSGSISISLNKAIGLGYFDVNTVDENSVFEIDVRGRKLKAKLTSLPFLKKK